MKLHRDSLKNLFVNHHSQLKLGAHQTKKIVIMWMILWIFLFANLALFVFQHMLKHSNFFLILSNRLSCVLEQEKALKVEEFPKLVTRIMKEYRRRFDEMKGGLILLHIGCSVNVSRPSTLNRSSSVMKQNALNNWHEVL